jgi:hypothetical protein
MTQYTDGKYTYTRYPDGYYYLTSHKTSTIIAYTEQDLIDQGYKKK